MNNEKDSEMLKAYQLLADCSDVMLGRLNSTGYLTLFNSINSKFKKTKQEIESTEFLHLIYEEDRIKVSKALEEIQRGETQPTPIIVRMILQNNELLWVYLTLSHQPDKYKSGILFRIQDYTAEKALNHARKCAELNSQTKSEFLAHMSHEIRTPLNAIVGVTSLLRETPLNTTQQEYLQTLESSQHALMSIINNILDFSKIEAKKLELENNDFHIYDLLEECRQCFQFSATNKKIELKVNTDECQNYRVSHDQNRLRQIIFNFVTNAIKFTARGFVEIKLQRVSQDDQTVVLRFEVKDTGTGISEKLKKSIFQPFSQADSPTTGDYPGTGLGLSICKSLVDLMQGKIGFESSSKLGSIFWFETSLNLAQAKSSSAPEVIVSEEPESPVKEEKGQNFRILLAEDNYFNQVVAIKSLDRFGFKIETAVNGLEVLTRMAESKFDLILMDCNMPEMDGYEATKKIRAQENEQGLSKGIPIIAMTANAIKGDRERCLDAGMNEYVTKPINFASLAKKIEECIRAGVNPSPAGKGKPGFIKTSPLTTSQDINNLNLDYTALERLKEIDPQNKNRVVREFIEVFLSNSEARIKQLKIGVEEKKTDLVFQEAHSLKAACGYIGAMYLRKVSLILEEKSNQSPPSWKEMAHLVQTMEKEFSSVSVVLKGIYKKSFDSEDHKYI